MVLRQHTEITSKSFAKILSSPYFPGLARLTGKKKRPSREYRTPKVPSPGESNTKTGMYIKYRALTMPTIKAIIYQSLIVFHLLDT
jgi:hypothetical protein